MSGTNMGPVDEVVGEAEEGSVDIETWWTR